MSDLDYFGSAVVTGSGLALVVIGAAAPPPRYTALLGAVLLIIGVLWFATSLIEEVKRRG